MNNATVLKVEEIADALRDAQQKMFDAIELLQGAQRLARNADVPSWIEGQLRVYTIPIIQRFATSDDPHQPGNIPKLIDGLCE